MAKPKRQSTRSQSSSKNLDVLTVDEAFQRVLQVLKDPLRACGLLNRAIEDGDAQLMRQRRKKGARPVRVKPDHFAGNYNVVPVKGKGVVKLRVGGFVGGEDPAKYIWTMRTKEINELTKQATSPSPAGAKRGRKPYEWDLFFAKCITRLDTNAVGPQDNVNIAELAEALMDWGGVHVGDKNTPDQAAMRDKVSSWVRTWQRMKELEAEAEREASRNN